MNFKRSFKKEKVILYSHPDILLFLLFFRAMVLFSVLKAVVLLLKDIYCMQRNAVLQG